jgi:Family of unknown function (DUF5906)
MSKKQQITFDDFVAYRPMHNYIFLPSREPWPASSVNAELPPVAVLDKNGKPVLDKKTGKPIMLSAGAWLDKNRPVHQMTWAPGLPMLIRDKVVAEGGWIDKPGAICLNLYRPPTIKPKAGAVKLWLDHVRKVYPDDAKHIMPYLAHRVQHPEDKINHVLFLGGMQGIGKDSLLEPVKHGVGPWNFAEVSPTQMLGRFNGFLKSVILRVSEARDLGESNRFAAYDHMKTYSASPPNTLRVDEKHLREHYVLNCCSGIITSNYLTEGIYLPADDRRTYVAWSGLTKDDFTPAYWKKLWKWYGNGGIENVVDYLTKLDISAFDAKAPPPKTEAFWSIVNANRAPEESELADILDKLGNPDVITIEQVISRAGEDFKDWLGDRRNRRTIPHRFEQVGYIPVRNKDTDDGLWRIAKVKPYWENGGSAITIESERAAIYAKKTLSLRDQIMAVDTFRREAEKKAKMQLQEQKQRQAATTPKKPLMATAGAAIRGKANKTNVKAKIVRCR